MAKISIFNIFTDFLTGFIPSLAISCCTRRESKIISIFANKFHLKFLRSHIEGDFFVKHQLEVCYSSVLNLSVQL
jgi:hypothetical protein